MGYDGFKLFMSSYLGESISDELCQILFWTFHKKVPRGEGKSPDLPNTVLKKLLVENGKCSQESVDHFGMYSNLSFYERMQVLKKIPKRVCQLESCFFLLVLIGKYLHDF